MGAIRRKGEEVDDVIFAQRNYFFINLAFMAV